jgi:hypothetical protein
MAIGRGFAKLSLLSLVAMLGFGFGLIRTINNEGGAPLTPLPESQRPAKLAALPLALDAFLSNPNRDAFLAARQAVIDYRRTFVDMSPETLQPKSESLYCADKFSPECRLLDERAKRITTQLLGQALQKYQNLSESTAEFHKKSVYDLTLDRRVHGNMPLGIIDHWYDLQPGETKLAATREKFFQQIDLAVAGNSNVTEYDLQEYLKIYATVAEKSLREIKRGTQCPRDRWPADLQLCNSAVQVISGMSRERDKAKKAATLKALVTARDATFEQMRGAVSFLMQ